MAPKKQKTFKAPIKNVVAAKESGLASSQDTAMSSDSTVLITSKISQLDSNNNGSLETPTNQHGEGASTISTQDTSTQDMFSQEASTKETNTPVQTSSQALVMQDSFLCSPVVLDPEVKLGSTKKEMGTPGMGVKRTPKKGVTPKKRPFQKQTNTPNLDQTDKEVQATKRAKKTPIKTSPVNKLLIQDTPEPQVVSSKTPGKTLIKESPMDTGNEGDIDSMSLTPYKVTLKDDSESQIGTSRYSSTETETPNDHLVRTPTKEQPFKLPITPFTPFSPYPSMDLPLLEGSPAEPMLSSQDYTPLDSNTPNLDQVNKKAQATKRKNKTPKKMPLVKETPIQDSPEPDVVSKTPRQTLIKESPIDFESITQNFTPYKLTLTEDSELQISSPRNSPTVAQATKRVKKTPKKTQPMKELPNEDTPGQQVVGKTPRQTLIKESPMDTGTEVNIESLSTNGTSDLKDNSELQIGTPRNSSTETETPNDTLPKTPTKERPIQLPITPFTPFSPYPSMDLSTLIESPAEPMLSSQDYTPLDSKFARPSQGAGKSSVDCGESTMESAASNMEASQGAGNSSLVCGESTIESAVSNTEAECSVESANVTQNTEMESLASQSSVSGSQASVRRNLLLNTRRPEVISCILATCPPNLDQRGRIEWLQEKRCVGIWAQCCECQKFRFLPDVHDPCALPRTGWTCSSYPGLSCDVPAEEPTALEEEHFLEDAYNAGSVVLAKLDDFPWWPAMVDDDPELEIFYWVDGLSDKPSRYHVTFFDSHPVSRAWLPSNRIKRYDAFTPRAPAGLKSRLQVAQSQARQALQQRDLLARLRKWSFVARYKGEIRPPKPVEKLMPLIQRIMKRGVENMM